MRSTAQKMNVFVLNCLFIKTVGVYWLLMVLSKLGLLYLVGLYINFGEKNKRKLILLMSQQCGTLRGASLKTRF